MGLSERKKVQIEIQTIKQDTGADSPVNLSPIERSPFPKEMIAYKMLSTLSVCDYGSPNKDMSPEKIDYLPRPRDKDNPTARHGSIKLLVRAPS